MIKYIIILFASLSILPQSGLTQNKKNSIHFLYGNAGISGALTLNCSRILTEFDGFVDHLAGTVTYGAWFISDIGSGSYQALTVGISLGPDRGGFQINVGGARLYNSLDFDFKNYDYKNCLSTSKPDIYRLAKPKKSDFVFYSIVGNLGFSSKKVGKKIFYIAGLGYPEGIYAGIGLAF